MALQAKYILIDDIDGSNAKDTVSFAVGRNYYEIDLNLGHLDEFNRDLDKWIKYARKVSARKAGRSGRVGSGTPNDAAKVRAWAEEQGIELAQRGRIPNAVREQYEEAMRNRK